MGVQFQWIYHIRHLYDLTLSLCRIACRREDCSRQSLHTEGELFSVATDRTCTQFILFHMLKFDDHLIVAFIKKTHPFLQLFVVVVVIVEGFLREYSSLPLSLLLPDSSSEGTLCH